VVSALIAIADAGHTILTPNTELAAALFDAIERAQRVAGRDVWATPRVRDFGGWLQERHVKRQFTDSSRPRCLSDAEERELWRRVVLESDSGQEFLEPAGAARAARRARRAIIEYDIPLRAVELYGTEESRVWIDWNARFTERCRALHCVSADELLMSLGHESGFDRSAEPIAWIESPVWRPVARRWLARTAGAPLEPMAAPQPGTARWLHASSPDAELAAMADWAGENVRANPNFRAWMCVPDLTLRREEVIDAFDAVLAPTRFALRVAEDEAPAYAVAGGTSLADYSSVRAALRFLAVTTGRVSFEDFSLLLRAPELQAAAEEACLAARLDVALRTRAPSEARFEQWLALAGRVARAEDMDAIPALERLHTAARMLEELSGRQAMSRWVALWIGAFEVGPWSLRHRWSSAEFQSAERFRELLAALAGGDRVFGHQARQSAEGILRRAALETQFQIKTGIAPIWVSGQLMDPWLPYDGLWIAGCDESRWPPPPDPIPLIPVRLQREYGVVAAGEESQFQFAADLHRRWDVRAAYRVWSGADAGEGRCAAPSPLLQPIAVGSPQPLELPAPRPLWTLQWNAAPVLEQILDEWAPACGAEECTRGVATLRSQSRCAFRGFADTRLMTRELEGPVPGFSDRERGELLHDALKRAWSELRDSKRLAALGAQARASLLNESALGAIAKLCERRDPGARWREREQLRLVALLDLWLKIEEQRAPFEVLRIEGQHSPFAGGSPEESGQTMIFAGLQFKVRIDRIDRLEDGGRILIDYKTGMVSPDWRGERPDNPQLPIYALAAPESLVAVAYGRINAAECCFVAETERREIFKPGGLRSHMEGAASLAELIARWSERVEKLAAQFARGRAVLDPTEQACQSCRLHGLCRVPSMLVQSADD